jgi:hypothetical protein
MLPGVEVVGELVYATRRAAAPAPQAARLPFD